MAQKINKLGDWSEVIMDIYNGVLVVNGTGEPTFQYEGNTYYRYMDKLYIPKPPAELNKQDVSTLSEVRIRLGKDIIDHDYSLSVVKHLFSMMSLPLKSKILDFGCGDGMFCSFIKNNKIENSFETIVGADISSFAVKAFQANHEGLSNCHILGVLFDDERDLDFPDEFFDGIISSFVMHFHIYDNQFKELYRVLKHGSSFVYNDYIFHRYKGHSQRVIQSLKDAGFNVTDSKASFKHPQTGEIKTHLMVSAYKA